MLILGVYWPLDTADAEEKHRADAMCVRMHVHVTARVSVPSSYFFGAGGPVGMVSVPTFAAECG